jgi:hypothetical protein
VTKGAPKGHPNYNTSKDPAKNGGVSGYLGKGEDYYTDDTLRELGEGLVEWIQLKGNIYCKYYFAVKGILWPMVHKLGARSPMFKSYLDAAKEIQEAKLVGEPYHKKADGNHARFILARHHKGEWEDKQIIVREEDEKKVAETMDLVNYLQNKAEPKDNEQTNEENEK